MHKLFLLFLVLAYSQVFAQSNLPIPLNIKKAYEKNTRSTDGNPGSNYWLNHSDYSIKASFNTVLRELKGSEEIKYYNNSPDTLKQIVVRLNQDFFKSTNPRNWEMPKEWLTDGTQIYSIKINSVVILSEVEDSTGRTKNLSEKDRVIRSGTNMTINLPEFISPKSETTIEIGWSFIIPKDAKMRNGQYDSTTFVIGYWYPQISVYDDVDGWDRVNYSGSVEFYNDFNNYDVEITLPNNFGAWATGTLQNAKEVLKPGILEKYSAAQNSDKVTNIIKAEDYKNNNPFQKNVWHFIANQVPDFVFGVSDHHLWDGVKYNNTFISAVYNPDSKDFYNVDDIAFKTIKMLSEESPGVPFPYPSMTVFNGGGAMEYPMFVNNGSVEDLPTTVHITSHEITHTYFPFYMGTNERKYAFMDEGWAVVLPYYIQSGLAPGYDPLQKTINNYLRVGGTELDNPIMTLAYTLDDYQAYRHIAYNKPALAYYLLREDLGHDLFDSALREYMKRWNGKHPIPYDFFYSFENFLKKDLSWYWKPWFFEKAYADLKIKDVNFITSMLHQKVEIENVGGLPLPVELTFVYEDGSEIKKSLPLNVWSKGKTTISIEQYVDRPVKKILLGSEHIPDLNKSDNVYEVK